MTRGKKKRNEIYMNALYWRDKCEKLKIHNSILVAENRKLRHKLYKQSNKRDE